MADALLVGGTHDGETIPAGSDPMPLAVQMVALEAANLWDQSAYGEVPVESYRLVRLVLFGRTVTVGLAPGVTEESAVPSMLSDAAFALWAKASGG